MAGRVFVELDDGILTTPSLRTTVDNVYAAGDIVRWTTRKGRYSRRSSIGPRRAHRANSRPENLLTGCDEAYAHAEYGWSDQYDRQFQMIGSFGSRVELVLGDGRDGPYVALSGDRNIVTGAIALDYHNAFKRARVWWQIVQLGINALLNSGRRLKESIPAPTDGRRV